MENKKVIKKAFKTAFPHTIPVFTGFITLGVAYGVLMSTKGFATIWAMLMSSVAFCGSMQFAAITLLASSFDPLQALFLSIMVNARHLFYGISMVERYRGAGAKKPYMIFALTDETYSLVCEGECDHKYFFAVSVFNQLYWVAGCCIGSLLGSFVTLKGVDFALTALFVTVFTEQWLSTKDHTFALVGIMSSVLCLVLFGADRFLIPAMIVITVTLTLIKKLRGGDECE
jgi:4-azaleucine resistance transporter AzlC